MENRVEFRVWGREALFTDPLSKIGGEKYSYRIPTYEAVKGILKSIYWKPTFVWVVDKVRVMNGIRTHSKSMKPLEYGGGNTLAIYTYLSDVEYQVQAHFEWNPFRSDLSQDRIDGKHYAVANRMIEKGGRQDIFLGTRECQGYIEPCVFGSGQGHYDAVSHQDFELMFHGFDYPDETGKDELHSRFWRPCMVKGVLPFPRPEACTVRKFVRVMMPKPPKSMGIKEETLCHELD